MITFTVMITTVEKVEREVKVERVVTTTPMNIVKLSVMTIIQVTEMIITHQGTDQ